MTIKTSITATGRTASAVTHLIQHSTLSTHPVFPVHYRVHSTGDITVDLPAVRTWASWSDGERTLIGVAEAMLTGGRVDLCDVLADLDTGHRRAVHDAIGLYLGAA